MQTSFIVGSEADLNAALAQIDLGGTSSVPATAYSISLAGNVALGSELYAINLAAGDTLSIDGHGHTLDGGGTQRGLFDYAGAVTITDLSIDHAVATGGAAGGGGAGAGLGGGLFVAAAGAVTLDGVTFAGDSAVGGSVDNTGQRSGGGGGLGGAGTAGDGGGGVGVSATGGVTTVAADGTFVPSVGAGIVLGAAPGGTIRFAGGAAGGGGGSGGPGGFFGHAGGAGGGIGGTAAQFTSSGGAGGFGGGGGSGVDYLVNEGANEDDGGNGGFGGGGGYTGGAFSGTAGNGGFGGGGGGGPIVGINTPGAGGFGGGDGFAGGLVIPGRPLIPEGGAGLGAGGAVFVQAGGSLSYVGGVVSGGSVAGGTVAAGYPADGDGSAFGAGLFLQGDGQVTLSATAAQPLVIADTIADQTGSTHQTGLSAAGDPLAGAGSLLIDGTGTVVLAAANTFSGGTTLTSGTLELATTGAAGGGDILFDGTAVLKVDGTSLSESTRIDGLGGGGAIDLRDVAFAGIAAVVSTPGTLGNVVLRSTTGSVAYALSIGGVGAISIAAAADGSVLLGQAPCYAAGTRIAVPGGEAAVETLRAGDRVVLAAGGCAALRWVGRRRVDLRRHPRPESVRPVRVRAGCLGAGLPSRDLLLSPEHALLLDGVLVPARVLVDGAAVTQEPWDTVAYHHLELARHAAILAEGVAAESYLDTGNRHQFAGGALASLHPEFGTGEGEPFAPFVLDGAVVEAARERLRGWANARAA